MIKQPRRRWRLAVAATFSALAAITFLVGMANVQAVPIVRRASLQMPGMAAGTAPIRIALLSDIHLGNRGMTPTRLSSIVAQVNAVRPDLILIAGDFVTGHDADGAAERAAGLTAPLSALRAPLGVLAVLGNHDHWTAPADTFFRRSPRRVSRCLKIRRCGGDRWRSSVSAIISAVTTICLAR
jgi:predicted MPP superfamily phosphohydrolase